MFTVLSAILHIGNVTFRKVRASSVIGILTQKSSDTCHYFVYMGGGGGGGLVSIAAAVQFYEYMFCCYSNGSLTPVSF